MEEEAMQCTGLLSGVLFQEAVLKEHIRLHHWHRTPKDGYFFKEIQRDEPLRLPLFPKKRMTLVTVLILLYGAIGDHTTQYALSKLMKKERQVHVKSAVQPGADWMLSVAKRETAIGRWM